MPTFIPCAPGGASSWRQQTALDGTVFQLTFDWNGRDGHWRFSIADVQGVAIRSGVVLVTDASLLQGVTDTRRPAGEIVVVDMTGVGDLDPGFSDLDVRFMLVYFTAADLA
jgi:hypothetical protein